MVYFGLIVIMVNPPLPDEPVPERKVSKGKASEQKKKDEKKQVKESTETEDDGWEHYFDDNTQRYYFYNRLTKVKQWLNPRVPKDDECNQNLPSFGPPKLPFEDETPYDKKLRELKDDSEFQKLSTFEKYKHVEALKKQLEEEEEGSKPSVPTSTDLQKGLKDIKPFNEDTNFVEYGSKSLYAQELNNSIRSINNNQNYKPMKITKKQIKNFNERKKQQREEKLKNWLTKD